MKDSDIRPALRSVATLVNPTGTFLYGPLSLGSFRSVYDALPIIQLIPLSGNINLSTDAKNVNVELRFLGHAEADEDGNKLYESLQTSPEEQEVILADMEALMNAYFEQLIRQPGLQIGAVQYQELRRQFAACVTGYRATFTWQTLRPQVC